MSNLLLSDCDDGVITITLNRARKKNALSVALRDEMVDLLEHLRGDEAVCCVILTGAGDTFSAGFDLGEFSVDDAAFQKELWESSDRFHHAVLGFPLPIVAAINGPALAGGFDLAVLCDIRIAATTARFSHPERAFGDVVYGPLHELVGGAVARELCLTGRAVAADEALSLGLVTQVVAPMELATVAGRVANQIAAFPRDLTIRTKAKFLARQGIDPSTPTLDL